MRMAREIDERKKRKALRKLRKAAELAEAGLGPPLSDWEQQFLEEVEERIEKYGSAFADPIKGNLEEPLSALQAHKLKEIDKKARGKGKGLKRGSGFKSKKPISKRGRDINDDIEDVEEMETADPRPGPPPPSVPTLVPDIPLSSQTAPKPDPNPTKTGWTPKVIEGGNTKDKT